MIKKKYLLIQTAFLGDLVLITSVLEKLFAQTDSMEIHLLVRKGFESVLNDYPRRSEIILHSYDKKQKLASWWNLFLKFRQLKLDEVWVFQRFFGMGLLSISLGAKKIKGFKENPLSLFFTKSFSHSLGDGRHEIERNNVFFEDDSPPHKPLLKPGKFSELSGKTFIFFAPGSVWETKRWPKEHWLRLVNQSPKDWQWVMSGAGAELDLCNEIFAESSSGRIINLAGKLNLQELVEVIGMAKLVVVNDSAPLHIASAMNIPTIALFCSTSPKLGFYPLSTKNLVIEYSKPLACKPCGKHGKKVCPEGHYLCGFGIEPIMVQQKIQEFLEN